MFPPITGKLQKIKINEKLTIFENFDGKKVAKSPLFSIFWHPGNQISASVHSNISLVGNRSKIIGKMNKKLSFTDGLSPSVLRSLDERIRFCSLRFFEWLHGMLNRFQLLFPLLKNSLLKANVGSIQFDNEQGCQSLNISMGLQRVTYPT